MKRLLSWFRAYRAQKRLALVAETAQLVIQQRGATWTNRTCPNCSQAVSDIANFCQMCGHSFVPELQQSGQESSQSVQRPYEIERHTSSIHPVMVPKRPTAKPKDDPRISALIRTYELPKFPAQAFTQMKQRKQKGS